MLGTAFSLLLQPKTRHVPQLSLSHEQDSARAAVGRQSCGMRDVTAHHSCKAMQRLFQISHPHLQCPKMMFGGQAKKHPTNQISWETPRAEQVSSPRSARRLPAQCNRSEGEPRKKKENKQRGNKPTLTLPSARAEPLPGTSLPSSSVCHLTEGRSPNLPFLLLPTWDGPTCPSWDPPTPLVLGEVQKKNQEQPKESNSNFEHFFSNFLLQAQG